MVTALCAWNGDNYGSTLDRTVGDADTIDAAIATIGLMGELVMIPSMQAKGPMRFGGLGSDAITGSGKDTIWGGNGSK